MPSEFGTRVQRLRKEKSLSQQDFCGDESDLSVRQLRRIEGGQSVPNLSKVIFIAKRLEVPVSLLINEQRDLIFDEYVELKYAILRLSSSEDPEKRSSGQKALTKIQNGYYADLTHEEQFIADCISCSFHLKHQSEVTLEHSKIVDYLTRLKVKEIYSNNDLIVLNLYLLLLNHQKIEGEFRDISDYHSILSHLLAQVTDFDSLKLGLVREILIEFITFLLKKKETRNVANLLSILVSVQMQVEDYQRKPIIDMLQWRYHLLINDFSKAEAFKTEAIQFTRMIKAKHLQSLLEREWERDMRTFDKTSQRL